MRTLPFLLVVLLACQRPPSTGATRSETEPDQACGIRANATLGDSGIGHLWIGETVDSVKAKCRIVSDVTEQQMEGAGSRVLTIGLDSSLMRVVVSQGRVWRIELATSRFMTTDSLGVGTRLAAFLSKPAIRGLEGEGALFVQTGSHCGMSFRTTYSPDENRGHGPWTRETLSRLPEAVTIDQVLIVGCSAKNQ